MLMDRQLFQDIYTQYIFRLFFIFHKCFCHSGFIKKLYKYNKRTENYLNKLTKGQLLK